MGHSSECADFFKSRREYDRCFAQLVKKWEIYGRTAGMIVLKNASEEERRAVGGILGKTFSGKELRFSFSAFEEGLQRTRFAPVEMKALLESYSGRKLYTNQERAQEAEQRKKDFFSELCRYFREKYGDSSVAAQWFACMEKEKRHGYALLMREFRREDSAAAANDRAGGHQRQAGGTAGCRTVPDSRAGELARQCGEALEMLASGGKDRPLAVLAAEVSGNPHCLDRGETAGQLLIQGLCRLFGEETPRDAHGWRALLMRAGIIPDTVSSLLHVYGLHIMTPDGLHPAYEAYCRCGEPGVVTLENLRNATGAAGTCGKAYIVENEMVFSYLLENLHGRDVTLLCTSGRMRSAAHVLIGLLAGSGCRIYYSGDMDPEGIDIADGLWRKYGDAVEIWRMSPEDYAKSLSEETVSEKRMAALAHIGNGVLRATAECLRGKGFASYQENLLEELLSDLRGGE